MEEVPQIILRELLAVSCFIAAVVFALISMRKDGREHFLRVCALFLVGVVVLFANSTYTYFAAVFIIATAVTQLEFLQNIAAIIRGSKEYFDYQKETLSRKEVQEKIEQELIEDAIATESQEVEIFKKSVKNDPPDSITLNLLPEKINAQHFAMIAYEFALNKLEDRYGEIIERYPRFVSGNRQIEFDGILETESKIIIFEVKASFAQVIPSRHLKAHISRIFHSSFELARLKEKSFEVRLVYVLPDESLERGNIQLSILQEELQAKFGKDKFSIEQLTYTDIGLGAFTKELRSKQETN